MLGFCIGVYRTKLAAKKYNFPAEAVIDISLVVLIFGVIGARTAFVLTNLGSFANDKTEMMRLWDGGLSFHGSLIGGLLGGLIYGGWYRKLPVWNGLDLFAPGVALGYGIARIGCFLNGCCYGSPTNLPWGIRFHDENNPSVLTAPSHPTQLYAMIINLILFAYLVRIEAHRKFPGQVFALFLILHGAYRFAIEFLRAGATSSYLAGGFTEGHFVAALMTAAGIIFYWIRSRTVTAAVHQLS